MPLAETASLMIHDLVLTASCLLCVPMYSAVVGLALYVGALGLAIANGHTWASALLLAYLPYCVLDARPTRPPGGGVGDNKDDDEDDNASADRRYSVTEWFRSLPVYARTAEYFPVRLHKTAELDPSFSYLFLYHPHGVIVQRHGVTLNVFFWSPLFREWMMLMGMISANKSTLVETLRNGRSVVLVPGGAQEALHAHRGNFRLHVRSRRGFVKVAMEARALLVPVLGFGENEAFETLLVDDPAGGRRPGDTAGTTDPSGSRASSAMSSFPWSLVHSCQHRFYRLTTFSVPILTRVRTNRTPIDVVVGAPVAFREGTTVEECHRQYLAALRNLYDDHKAAYGYQYVTLEFV